MELTDNARRFSVVIDKVKSIATVAALCFAAANLEKGVKGIDAAGIGVLNGYDAGKELLLKSFFPATSVPVSPVAAFAAHLGDREGRTDYSDTEAMAFWASLREKDLVDREAIVALTQTGTNSGSSGITPNSGNVTATDSFQGSGNSSFPERYATLFQQLVERNLQPSRSSTQIMQEADLEHLADAAVIFKLRASEDVSVAESELAQLKRILPQLR